MNDVKSDFHKIDCNGCFVRVRVTICEFGNYEQIQINHSVEDF